MDKFYLYYSLLLPIGELSIIQEEITAALVHGNWTKCKNENEWQRDDMYFHMTFFDLHPEDILLSRRFPSNYKSMDIVLRSKEVGDIQAKLPWDVLSKGMRKKDRRENPIEIMDLSILQELQPFHVEIGCGMSIEAGVPPLHHLHSLYSVTDIESGTFIFGNKDDDLIPRILINPEEEMPRFGKLFSSSFQAEPTIAHKALGALEKHGYLLGPVFTNNFDGLIHRSGLTELFLRRYDESVPEVKFDDRAKALLVIGNHADRRRVQERARNKGLKIVYLDTEGYMVDGNFMPYPLEGPKSVDFLCKNTATEGLTNLCNKLRIAL